MRSCLCEPAVDFGASNKQARKSTAVVGASPHRGSLRLASSSRQAGRPLASALPIEV